LIQAAMTFALGVLVAGLLVLLVTPAIWRRAMRLARTRIEASVPLSRAEIEADKDQLRAGFAVANRRLEMETGRLRERLAEESIAVSRHANEAAALSRDKEALVGTIASLEERIAGIAASLAETGDKLAETIAEVAARDVRLAEQEATLSAVRTELGAAQLMTEELRLEMVARQTEIGNLSDRLAEKTTAEQTVTAARDGLAGELAAERTRLAEEQARLQALEAGFDVLQTERTGRIADLERPGRGRSPPPWPVTAGLTTTPRACASSPDLNDATRGSMD
jgi:regulator of replication initiation timing